MSVPIKQPTTHSNVIEAVIAHGDLSKLTAEQRNDYYAQVCRSLGLNPLTQPFEYITLNGKLRLYAKRDCADQLRKINGISISIVSQEMSDGLLTVHVRAKDSTGREDEDLGVVNFPDTLRGEARANAILKAVTKAKRRVTLSISGLGFLDETEVDDIEPTKTNGAHVPAKPSNVLSDEQADRINAMLAERECDIDTFLKLAAAPSVSDIKASKYSAALAWLLNKPMKKAAAE